MTRQVSRMDRKKAINILSLRRQNAIGTLGNLPREANYTAKNVLVDEISAYDMAIEALQEPEQKWIPVSERLPEEEGRYLCAYGKNLMCVYSFSNDLFSVDDYDFAKYKFEKQKGFYAYDSEWGYWEVDFIKAWQTLPEPFKESEEE